MAAPDIAPGVAPEPSPRYAIDNARGAAWMLISVVTASVMTLGVRWAAVELDSRVIVTLRSLGGLALCLIALALAPRLRRELRFTAPWLHIWRGALLGCSTQFGFYTIINLPLATSTVLFFSAGIFTALLAIPLQGERIGPRRAGAIIAGFVGVLIVMRPGAQALDFAMLSALVSSVLFALALLSSRGLATHDGAFNAYISSAVMTALVSVPLAIPVWEVPRTGWVWGVLGVIVLASLVRNIADIQAYRWAEAAVMAPLSYLRLIFIAAAGYFVFDEKPDVYTVIGGGVIIGAALYIAQRERLLSRPRKAQKR